MSDKQNKEPHITVVSALNKQMEIWNKKGVTWLGTKESFGILLFTKRFTHQAFCNYRENNLA